MNNNNILYVDENPAFDDAICRMEYHTHQTYSSSKFDLNDEMRITIQQQDIYTLPSESFLYIEGKLTSKSGHAKFVNNGVAFLFDEIRYEIGGVEIDRVKNPGVTTTMKNYISCDENDDKVLKNSGWSAFESFPDIIDAHGNFSVCIPLKMLLGFAEDYRKIIMNVKQELILIRSNSNLNAVITEGPPTVTADGDDDITINLDKIYWKVPYIQVADMEKLHLLNILNKNDNLNICFRSWELYNYPELQQTQRHNWMVKTSFNLEKPRYVILAFQTDRDRKKDRDSSKFNHCDLTNVKVYLNGETYPYDNLNLNFDNNQYALLYDKYAKFQNVYYGRINSTPLLDRKRFKEDAPLIFIDCSKQSEVLKSTQVDLRVEFESHRNFPANTTAHCLIIHDRIIQYNALTNIVLKVI